MNKKTAKIVHRSSPLRGRSFLSITDISPGELQRILDTAIEQKKGHIRRSLRGTKVALIFEKPSLRTKVSFDVAIKQLGGHGIYLGQNEIGLGERESIADAARTLSRYVQGIVARTFSHDTQVELAKHSGIPVVNALSDDEHPCQALADVLTIQEHKGKVHGLRAAFIGDGNNVAVSLAQAVASLGGHFAIASPAGYELPGSVAHGVREIAKVAGGSFLQVRLPKEVLEGADVVYTDVWTSMGDEASAKRTEAFRDYQVTPKLMTLAKPDAIFMHDLPAHRGEEVLGEVIDGPQSVVFDQAENRLHAQRALLHLVLGSRTIQ